jgi:hypothetical protein
LEPVPDHGCIEEFLAEAKRQLRVAYVEAKPVFLISFSFQYA